jgi:RNA polymerase sigma-70 factor (ECF subfamily)
MRDAMHDQTARLAGSLLTVDQTLDAEFEARLVESSTLAFRVAYGVLRHRQDAEDVAQEAFVKAYRSFRELRDRERFRAWLVRMTWRLAIDRQRNDRRRIAREGSPEGLRYMTSPVAPGRGSAVAQGFSPPMVEDLAARERAERLWAAIDALPEKLRVAIVLANIEGHDVGEVARLLNLPEGTVKSRLFLARQRLKERLQ